MSHHERVWIVDDDKSIRWVLEKALNQAGIQTTCFEDGEAVTRRLNQDCPDAIISDIRMPGMDGLELLDIFPVVERVDGGWRRHYTHVGGLR